jgi:DnaJ-class molecular chaperone
MTHQPEPERLLRCLRCSGTGYATPPRPDRPVCPACLGEGEVPEDHQWAGYELSMDFRGGARG